jgi:FAD-linked oxidoreductase
MMKNSRRTAIKAGVALGAVGGLGLLAELLKEPVEQIPSVVPPAAGKPVWSNWSGINRCQPAALLTPQDEQGIVDIVRSASGGLRCVGAGHSFTPLVPTDGTLISLDQLAGIVDHQGLNVRVKGGTRLAQLERELDALGLALHNQADIDAQSYAGAISTATHGTGRELQALHAKVQALRIVTPSGQTIECSTVNQPDLLHAAQVSLGSLGVITEATVEVVPAFRLHRQVWLKPLEEMLAIAPDTAKRNRHFEFFYLPFTGYAAAITHNVYQGDEVSRPPSADESMLHDLRQLRDWAGRFPQLRRWLAQKLIDPAQTEEAKDRSWKLLSTSRPSKFNETEFHVPREAGIACVREVIQALERHNDAYFPVEFRFVKADDAWLSPFYQRDACSIAVHAAGGEAYRYFADDIEPIYRKYQGRPHWGKLHTHQASDFAGLYPKWKDFLEIRKQYDPTGRMLNPHLRQVFGVAA